MCASLCHFISNSSNLQGIPPLFWLVSACVISSYQIPLKMSCSITLCHVLQEHMGFDNEIAALDKAIKLRKRDLSDLENMCTDAQLARDMAKVSKVRYPKGRAHCPSMVCSQPPRNSNNYRGAPAIVLCKLKSYFVYCFEVNLVTWSDHGQTSYWKGHYIFPFSLCIDWIDSSGAEHGRFPQRTRKGSCRL